jgi:PspA/IM30 family
VVSTLDRRQSHCATRMLEQKLAEAKSKKDTLKARAKSAAASKQITEMIQGLNTSNALTAFEKMEEKVMSLEAESESTLQVGLPSSGSGSWQRGECRTFGHLHVSRTFVLQDSDPGLDFAAVSLLLMRWSPDCQRLSDDLPCCEPRSWQRRTTLSSSSRRWRATPWTTTWQR